MFQNVYFALKFWVQKLPVGKGNFMELTHIT